MLVYNQIILLMDPAGVITKEPLNATAQGREETTRLRVLRGQMATDPVILAHLFYSVYRHSSIVLQEQHVCRN